MFKKGDIVQFKNIDNKWYKNRLYEICITSLEVWKPDSVDKIVVKLKLCPR